MRYVAVALVLTACGTAGNNLSKGGRCINSGDDCHEENPYPSPSPGSQGPQGPQGIPGAIGPSGAPGANGAQGPKGDSCSVVRAVNGSLITCGQDQVLILDGTSGQDGQDGQDAPPTPYTVVGLVDPCGDKPGVYDEVFLRLANGQLIASFSDNSNGLNTRFSVIGPGNYVTTDGSHCYFSVDSNNQLINEHY